MSLYHNISAFSPNSDYFAYSSPDGCLKIWETSTNILKQEYTPSSHLSATCSSLSWGPSKQNPHSGKRSKKFKSGSISAVENLQLIAIGTMTGDILLYSFTNSKLLSSLADGHSSAVNDLCWCESARSLYSCSNDHHIIVWDISSGKVKSKWKADKVAVHSICVIDENNLLSASSSIFWWNVTQKTVIKSFSGHATEVFQLLPFNAGDRSSHNYFVSAAIGDRVINVWQLQTEDNSKGNVASFVSSGEPGNIDVMATKNEPFRMSVVTLDGAFQLFEHALDGKKSKKPLQPKFTVQIASKATEVSTKPQYVPILAVSMSEGFDSCLLMYGNFLKPIFERINISDVSKDLFLIRDVSSSSAVSLVDAVTRIKQTVKPNDVKVLAPGHMTDVTLSQSLSQKRKQTDDGKRELPLEELLKALDLSKIPENLSGEEPSIKTDSMVHLLLQGLQSKDNNMLNTVLQCGEETVIHNTLKRLPLSSILPMIRLLHNRLTKRESRNHHTCRWLFGLIAVHMPYLMSCKDLQEYLGPVSQLLEAHIENCRKLSQLGCLKVLLDQAEVCPSIDVADVSSQPLAEYISESSDDSDNDEIEENSSEEEEEVDALNDESESDSDMEEEA